MPKSQKVTYKAKSEVEKELQRIRGWINSKRVKKKHSKAPGKYLGRIADFQMFQNGRRVLMNSVFGNQFSVASIKEAKELVNKQAREMTLLRAAEVSGFERMAFDKPNE